MKSKWKNGWKIITARGRRSCIRLLGSVIYDKQKIVASKKGCGPLCVFSNKRKAYKFIKDYCHLNNVDISRFELVKCSYMLSSPDSVWISNSIWHRMHLSSLPPGTVLADKVKCLE